MILSTAVSKSGYISSPTMDIMATPSAATWRGSLRGRILLFRTSANICIQSGLMAPPPQAFRDEI